MRAFAEWPVWARGAVWAGVSLLGMFVLFRWLLPVLFPFAAAFILARLMEPGVLFLTGRTRLPRGVFSAVFTLLMVSALGASAWFMLSWIFREAAGLMDREFILKISETTAKLTERFGRWIEGAPDSMRAPLRAAADGLLAGSASIPLAAIQKLTAWGALFAAALPRFLASFFATVLSTFLISSDYPRVTAALIKPFPNHIREKITVTKKRLGDTIGRWVKAEALLGLCSFGVLLIGFTFMGVRPSLLPAAIIALIDALPALGSGICLLPWALFRLIAGDGTRAAGLVVLFVILTVTRAAVGPKLLGKQIGMGALPTFMAMYIGYISAGVLGLILFPVILISIITAASSRQH